MINNYQQMFGCKPIITFYSLLEQGNYLELDNIKEFDLEGIKKCQSLIGAVQQTVLISRFDVAMAVMILLKFRADPRVGYLD